MEPPSVVETSAPVERGPRGWLRTVIDAVRGSATEDYTREDLGRAIILLAIPMVLEMVLESVFAVVDTFFVARLGADAVATVGLTEAMLTLIFAVAMGLSMATTAMVARRIGESDREGAAVAAAHAIGIGVLVSLITAVVGVAAAPALLGLMGASASVIEMGYAYTAILIGGSLTIFLLFLINAIFRGAGDAAIAMRVLWFSNLINLVLDPCLIFGLGPFPELGLTGAAIATTIGRGIGVAFQLWVLFGGHGRIHLQARHFRFDPAVAWRLLRVSGNGIFQFLIQTASWIGLVRIVAIFGSGALAGYTIAIRIIIFTILPSWGLSNAAATLVGQNLGAGRPDRAERSVWLTSLYNMVFLGLVSVVFVGMPEPLVRIFTRDPEVVAHGVDCLRYVSSAYVFYAFGMVIVQAFNGAGDTRTPAIINLFCYWMFQIPMAWALALPLGLGPVGVFLSIAIAESVLAVVSVLVFRRGKWREQKI
jgi:putative MATE family efflux protein